MICKPNKTILIFFFLIIVFSVKAISIPELRGHINDYANILDSRAEQIDKQLTALENETTVQVVILTIPSLPEDYTIEEYSIKVAEAWQLGQKGKDNGVLITVALNDHKMRIGFGYGLEGVLTDAQAKLIILRRMTPKFKENDYTGGLIDAVNDICVLMYYNIRTKEKMNTNIMNTNIKIQEERVSAEEYIDFLKRTDLGSQYPKERFEERIAKLVKNVSISLIARNEDGLIIGALFGLTDFCYWLYITDLGVDKDYERQGIASKLMKTALDLAGGEKDIAVYLIANENAIPFYEKLGMKKSDDVMQYNHIE